MDVDTPSGTNSGAGKAHFEVRKRNTVTSGSGILWLIMCHPQEPHHGSLHECAVAWGVCSHALIPTAPLDGPERGRCVHWTTEWEFQK